jgi:hypothetical protein
LLLEVALAFFWEPWAFATITVKAAIELTEPTKVFCQGQHPLIYEDDQPTLNSWGYVECDWESVLAVVEGRVLADTPLQIDEQ